LEKIVLSSFIHDHEYNSTVSPHITPDWFEDEANKVLISCALEYSNDHKKLPPKIVMETILDGKLNVPEAIYQKAQDYLNEIYSDHMKAEIQKTDLEWKLKNSLVWFKERAAYNMILTSMDIIEGKYKVNGVVVDKSAIPDMMQKAISITFDTSIGHDYFADAEERFEFMHTKVNKIPFKIPILNKITNGGIERGTLNEILCPTHGGKTLAMGSLAVDWLELGYNVLAITLEMAEMKIGERIDAKTLNVEIDQLRNIPKKNFLSKLKELETTKGYGKLIVKQYPTSSAGADHFRFLLNELETKQGFIPDVVVIDYLGICISTRFKRSDNMYQIQKSVSEEIRGLAVQKNVAIFSALQTNKNGMGAADFDMTDISESSGHAMTADFMIGLISTPELIGLGQVRVKQLKNRYGSVHEFETFLLNMDRKKMLLFEDSDYTRNHSIPEPEHKKPDAVITKPNNKFDSLRSLK
jgi:hypothetical protein